MKIEISFKGISGSELHSKGASLREEDKHLEALGYLTMAIVLLQREKNYSEIIDTLKDRCLTWKHLFLTTNDRIYAILARDDAQLMLAIAQEKNLNEKFSTSYFRQGEVDMLFENYPSAIKHYQLALDSYTGSLSEKGDFRYHLGEAMYLDGEKKEGKKLILAGLEEIKAGADEIDPFLIHVWESGVHKRLAELLYKDEPEESKSHFLKAQQIAKSDPKLVIRRRQIEDLGKTLKFL